MMKFYSFFVAILLLPLVAQAQEPVDIANGRGSNLIDSTMASINIRAQLFNEQLAKVNAIKALDVPSLEKSVIPKNKETIKDFLSYLDVYRDLSKKMMSAIQDSLKDLRLLLPTRQKEGFMKDFLDAYKLDQNAFDEYTLSLTKVFTNVIKVLDFMASSKVTIADKKLQFTDKKEYEDYNKLISEVEKTQKKLATAGAESQKASIDASSMMQKAYGKLHK
ncbi:MAG: hypothetical protein WCH46_05400 [bacterium]